MKITIVAGARPNFIKIAPIIKAIEKKQNSGANVSYRLVHTGQHYDKNLSDTFFEELNIPHPNANLEVKSGSQSVQTAAIMIAFEQELIQNPCDLVLVVGDVNSTMACAIVSKKLNKKLLQIVTKHKIEFHYPINLPRYFPFFFQILIATSSLHSRRCWQA